MNLYGSSYKFIVISFERLSVQMKWQNSNEDYV